MPFKSIISKIRRKLVWNKNLIPNISQTSRSNQSLEEYKLLIEHTGYSPFTNKRIIILNSKV